MQAKIEETPTLKSALNKIQYDTWIFFDLDNTVMESTLDLGGDQWFTHLMKYIPKCDQHYVFTLYYALQTHVRMQLAEPKTALIINALQDVGLPVFALTARDTSILHPTIKQLNDIGIDFSKNQRLSSQDSRYSSGIICCCGQNKGESLTRFLNSGAHQPRHIIMFDDKGYHLEHIQKAVTPLNIHFSGLRYGFLDAKITAFDMNKANEQLAYIKERLPLDAQIALDKLKLVSECFDKTEQFAHGFFPLKASDCESSNKEMSGFLHKK